MLPSVTKPPAIHSYLIAVNVWLLFLTKYYKGHHIKLYEMSGALDSHGGEGICLHAERHTSSTRVICNCGNCLKLSVHLRHSFDRRHYVT